MTRSAEFIRPALAAALVAACIAVAPFQAAHAQRPSLGGIDQKLDDIQGTLGPVPGANAPDIQQQIDALKRQNDDILSILCNGSLTPLGVCSKLAFVTSERYSGDLASLGPGTGIENANAECNRLAGAAGLPGVYKAWISDSNSSPSTTFTQFQLPYVLPTGLPIANDWADLTDGSLARPFDRDETGALTVSSVWTNTTAAGALQTTANADHCVNWSPPNDPFELASVGNTTVNWEIWTEPSSIHRCDGSFMNPLYCIQQ